MTPKTKKIIAREGLVLVSVLLILFVINHVWGPMRVAHYRKECQRLEEANNIKTIKIDYHLWGGIWDKSSWDTDSINTDLLAMVQVVDRDGNVRLMDKNKTLRGKGNGFDISTAKPVEELSKEEKERLEKIYKSNEEKLRIAQRVVSLKDYNYIPPYNSFETAIFTPLGIIILAYPIYAIVRIVMLLTWLIKTKKLTKESVVRAVKIAFSKNVLIKVALILGIMFLSVSLLKSCSFIENHRSLWQ